MQQAGHCYHVYNRGCNREAIFALSENYIFLLRKIKTILPTASVSVIAYCLMPNHYHFLLRAEADNAISHFIQQVFNGYVQAFNKQQQRSGTLFEGRAKTILVDTDAYALDLCRYIHLNPVQAHLVANPEDWPYSNYLEWIGQRAGTLKDEVFMREYFPDAGAYRSFITDYQDERRKLKALEKYMFD